MKKRNRKALIGRRRPTFQRVPSQTPVVSTVSELKPNSPSSCSPSLLRFSPLPAPLPPLLSPVLFLFFFALRPLCPLSRLPLHPPLQLPLIVPLQTAPRRRWTYSPRSLCAHGRARSQTEAERLNGAAAGEISARLHYWRGKKKKKAKKKAGRFHQRPEC